ncbi:MAG: putative sulfate exporter family transporter [Acidobacteriota bacterium]
MSSPASDSASDTTSVPSLGRRFGRLLPGLAVAAAVAAAASWIHGQLPAAVGAALGAVVLAVLLGLALSNLVALPEVLTPGIRASYKTVLKIAIVFLGARLAMQDVLAIGGEAVVLIVLLMTLALVLAGWAGRRLGVPTKLAALIGVGTAVCGNSAISAVAPGIDARDEEVSFAIATNTLFGTLAVFTYPLLAHAIGLSDAEYGTWAGTAVNDTSQVVAAGFAVSVAAGETATAVKLTRNALMGAVIVLMGWLYGPKRDSADPEARIPWRRRLAQSFPPFVLGFLLLATARSLGWLDSLSQLLGLDVVGFLTLSAKLLILVALAGVGLGTRFSALRSTGWRPLVVGLAVATAVSVASLAWILTIGPAG